MVEEISMKKVKLFCIPYAGGSATMFFKLRHYLKDTIELCPVELPGRGTRFEEKGINTIEEMAVDVYAQIKHQLNVTYSLLGYSMGGLVAYEVYKLILHDGKNALIQLPQKSIYAAVLPPKETCKYFPKPIHQYSDDHFLDEVIALGGTPINNLSERTILKDFIGILRNDFKAVWEYENVPHSIDVHLNEICVLYSDSEEKNSIKEWAKYTNRACSFYHFDGGHFFINEKTIEFANIINSLF